LARDHFALLVEEASTDFLIMAHGDDWLVPERCASLWEVHRRTSASLVLSQAMQVDAANRELGCLKPVPLEKPQAASALERLHHGDRLAGYMGAFMGWHR